MDKGPELVVYILQYRSGHIIILIHTKLASVHVLSSKKGKKSDSLTKKFKFGQMHAYGLEITSTSDSKSDLHRLHFILYISYHKLIFFTMAKILSTAKITSNDKI